MAARSLITAAQCFPPKTKEEEENVRKIYKRFSDLVIPELPMKQGWACEPVYLYQGYWIDSTMMQGTLYMQSHFKARPTDILIASYPQSGTTWISALIYSIVNRVHYKPNVKEHPLLTFGVKDLVPYLELHFFRSCPIGDPEILPSPRLLCTHVPYSILPESVTSKENCRMVYIWRNPKDVLVSMRNFDSIRRQNIGIPPISYEEASDLFLQGFSSYGPWWDHVLGYWKASVENPCKILFIKYDDMKSDTISVVKRLAEFMGCPFTSEEEEARIVHDIVELCGFDSMSKAVISDEGNYHARGLGYKAFFRKGIVGDWKNHLSEYTVRRLDEVTEEMFKGTGLQYKN